LKGVRGEKGEERNRKGREERGRDGRRGKRTGEKRGGQGREFVLCPRKNKKSGGV